MTHKKILTIKTTIILLSIFLIGLTYLAYWIEGWVGVYLLLAAGISGLVLIGFFISGLFKFFRVKEKGLLVSLTLAIFAFVTVLFRPVETIIEKFKSPVVLYGYCEHTVTGLSIKLRQDSSFEYNAGAFLSREMYYGQYAWTGDTLTLKFNDNVPENINDKLLLANNSLTEISSTTKHKHQFKISYNNTKK